MLISEVFYSLQGEGPLAGRPSVFVRTAGCDYRCAWCDTKYAVWPEHAAEWQTRTPESVLTEVRDLMPRPGLVTLTGGNPALQKDMGALLGLLHQDAYEVACETQGSVAPRWFHYLDWLIVSPKGPSSGHETITVSVAAAIEQGADRTALKFVIASEADYRYARSIAEPFRTVPVYLQPAHLDDESESETRARWQWLAARVLDAHWDVTVLPQLHVLLWGGERGR